MSPISSPSIEVSTDSIESEKVSRLCRFGQNLPLSERIQPENLFPFTSVQWTPTAAVCTMDADGSGNKRLTEKSEDKTAYRLVQIGPDSICYYFIIQKGYFLETQIKWAGGQLRSFQKNQNPCVFFAGTLGLLAPFVSVRLLVSFHQCLFYVRSPVENLAAYLCVRQNTVVSVVLQSPPAHFQQVRHFLVRQ